MISPEWLRRFIALADRKAAAADNDRDRAIYLLIAAWASGILASDNGSIQAGEGRPG